MSYKRILIVEDDLSLSKGLQKALEQPDREIIAVNSFEKAGEQLSGSSFDLILLDINLPDGDGFDLLEEIKSSGANLSVILLTAKDTDIDIVNGLEAGADDYITKPFSLSVLRARVNLQLRKVYHSKHAAISFGEYFFDFAKQKFSVGGREVELSKTEQRLLYFLVQNRGNTLTREQLIDKVWGTALYIDENALSVAVKRLRDKLNATECIRTVYGIGYRWVK